YLNAQRSDLYELSLYLVLLYEPPARARTSLGLHELLRAPLDVFSSGRAQSRVVRLLDAELQTPATTLHQKTAALEVQLSDFGLRLLDKHQIFRLLRELLNLDRSVADASRLTRDVYVDFFAADSAVDCHRDHLVVGNRTVTVLSLK